MPTVTSFSYWAEKGSYFLTLLPIFCVTADFLSGNFFIPKNSIVSSFHFWVEFSFISLTTPISSKWLDFFRYRFVLLFAHSRNLIVTWLRLLLPSSFIFLHFSFLISALDVSELNEPLHFQSQSRICDHFSSLFCLLLYLVRLWSHAANLLFVFT